MIQVYFMQSGLEFLRLIYNEGDVGLLGLNETLSAATIRCLFEDTLRCTRRYDDLVKTVV